MINSFIKSYYNLDYKNLFYILKNSELMSLNDFEIIKRLGNHREPTSAYFKRHYLSTFLMGCVLIYSIYRRGSVQ
jgi:hypothetical protein